MKICTLLRAMSGFAVPVAVGFENYEHFLRSPRNFPPT
jgi:hypothetical protein